MSYVSEVLADSPLAYWRLNEASGNPQDSSGNGHHVSSVIGTPTYGQTSPITSDAAAKAMSFAGNSGLVVPDAASGDWDVPGNTEIFSMECWMKLAGNGTVRYIFNKQSGNFGLYMWSDNILQAGKVDTGAFIASASAITDTAWHHVVAVKNGASGALYIDGASVGGSFTNQDIIPNDENLRIGVYYNETQNFFNDMLCELAIYGSALSLARAQAHYAAATVALDTVLPDADITTTGWSTAPLFSKINDDSDATVIQATAS